MEKTSEKEVLFIYSLQQHNLDKTAHDKSGVKWKRNYIVYKGKPREYTDIVDSENKFKFSDTKVICKMKKSEAKNIMLEFANKNKGKNVLFNTLNAADKKAYILIKTFNYFKSFLKVSEALTRAIDNTEAHERDNFSVFTNKINENMTIAKI